MSIKVIGAGFPRTGTSSLKQALETLGIGECYHMKNLLIDPYRLSYWNELEANGTTSWEDLFNGFQAVVDIPGYLYYKDLLKQYPDAKIILSVRPFENWYASVQATVYQAIYPSIGEKVKLLSQAIVSKRLRKAMKCIMMVERTFFDGQFQKRFTDKDFAEKVFKDHIQSVKEYVPDEKLLLFEAKEGWEPLCTFLQKPIPDIPFPHSNKKEDFPQMLKKLVKGEMA